MGPGAALDQVMSALHCPVCAASLGRIGPQAPILGCAAGHRFDIARQGYVSLLSGRSTGRSSDTAEMIAARRAALATAPYRALRTAVAEAVAQVPRAPRDPEHESATSSLYTSVPFNQDASFLVIGERTNSNGSKGFRDAMIAQDYQHCLDVAKEQTRDGAHMLDLNVDYVGRDGALDMAALATRFATSSTLPMMIDSTEPEVIRAGLEALGGRSAVNSVNFEDGELLK